MQKAVDKFGVSSKTIYSWRGKTEGKKEGMSVTVEGEYLVIRVPKKVAFREALGSLL